MLLKIAQTFSDQASTAMFVPGFMATYCHAKPLLPVSKAQKASPTVRTSENRILESIMKSYFKPIATHYELFNWPIVGLRWGDKTSKAFVLS